MAGVLSNKAVLLLVFIFIGILYPKLIDNRVRRSITQQVETNTVMKQPSGFLKYTRTALISSPVVKG